MITESVNKISVSQKVRAYFQILKFRLSFLVAFSGAIAFILASYSVDYFKLLILVIGGITITGAANIINQIKEIEFDKLMKRTKDRPLPTGVMTVQESIVYAFVLGIIGFVLH